MRKHYPLNSNGAEDAGQLPWIDGVPSTGTQGSFPGHAIVTDAEAEILAAIDASGQARNGSDLAQLVQAIGRGIYLGQFSGSANTLGAAIPNNVVFSGLQVGTRFSGFVATPNTGSVTVTITGIGTAGGTVQASLLRKDGAALQAGDLAASQIFEIRWNGTAFQMVSSVASDAGSASAITQISLALENNIATTIFQNPTNTGMANGSATALVFADNSTTAFANNGIGTFTCNVSGVYLVNITTTITTTINQSGSNDVFVQIVINGQILGFNKSPYYASGAANYIEYVSANLQRAVIRLNAGDQIVFSGGATVPAGFVSAVAQNHVATFTRLF